MVITTTNEIQDKKVIEYKGIVFGGRSKGYEDELLTARENALEEMKTRATNLGANAIIGVKMDYEVLGADNGMLMVTCSGTAVVVG